MSILSHIGAGLIGASVALVGVGIYIKKYHEKSDVVNIDKQCYQPKLLVAKKPINLLDLKTTSPLFTSIGKMETPINSLDRPASQLIPELDLPVLHDFAKLETLVQDAASHLDSHHTYNPEANSVKTVCTSSDEKDVAVLCDNPIILLADMKNNLTKKDEDLI